MLNLLHQVKATAENVDEAVRELPDANSVRYSFLFIEFEELLLHVMIIYGHSCINLRNQSHFSDANERASCSETRGPVGYTFSTGTGQTTQKGWYCMDSNKKGIYNAKW